MSAVPAVFLAVAQELAGQAKASLPKLREDEKVLREYYANGIFYQETALNGEIFRSSYNFRQRKAARRQRIGECSD